MDCTLIKQLNDARQERRAVLLVQNLADGEVELVFSVNELTTNNDFLKEAIGQAFQTGKSRTIAIGEIEYFINVFLPPPRLVVIGAVHITQHLVQLAKVVGYDLEVIDPRTAFTTAERFSNVNIHADWPQDVLKLRPLDPYCALVAVTHDPKIDDFALIDGLKQNCFFVGALGSRKTHAKRVARLLEAGLSQSVIDQIHAPIGVDISASGPAEIAMSIMAQIVGAFRTRGQ